MSWSKITLVGIEEWLNYDNKSVFDGLRLPEGIDLETLKADIMLQGGDFEVLYANPDFMTSAVSKWGLKWYRTFEKWVNALSIEYEPLYNYDRNEEWTDTGTGSRENETSAENKTTRSNKTTGKSTEETTNTRSAYDSSSYQPHDKSVTESQSEVDSNGEDNSTGSGTLSETTENASDHKGHIFGNIGVKTTQSMLLEELSVAEWNLYDHITDLFIKELTIPIYE